MPTNDTKPVLLSQTEAVEEAVAERVDRAFDWLLSELTGLFGAVQMRGLDEYDRLALRDILRSLARGVTLEVEGAHVRQRSEDSMRHSFDILRAVLAGGANERRNLTGEEPDEGIHRLVLGHAQEDDGRPDG